MLSTSEKGQATMVGDDGGRRRWVTKSLECVKHERGTGDQGSGVYKVYTGMFFMSFHFMHI